MSPDRHQRIKDLFNRAAAVPAAERVAFLDRECAGDAELRSEVDLLLAMDGSPTAAVIDTGSPPSPPLVLPPDESAGLVGKRLGKFHLKRLIGSGGMGAVYEAMQDYPRRVVALKVMRSGIASRSALKRFEYEVQILARLRHPGVAQMYEAGVHREDGREVPYFAMEYIPSARPITDYADEKKLSTRDRLALFAMVCDAVHHGHQKGIIHRDLKPSNILVDTSGQPKVIDFGVARSTDSDLAVTTLQTDVGQLIGTLQYMSPEQCAADPHDLDTRSDVYALGVVLYELLAGRPPYDLTRVAYHEAARVIREQPPTKPSTISRNLRGDIETIALKALEKDRQRRYTSAAEFGADVQRYLSNEPISARPPSLAYQIRTIARRNRGVFGATAAFVAVVFIGAVAFAYQAHRIRLERDMVTRERDRAIRAEEAVKVERDKAIEAESTAKEERARAEAVLDLLLRSMISQDPASYGRADMTVAEAMTRTAGYLDRGDLKYNTATELMLRRTICHVLIGNGKAASAEPIAERALDLAERLHPEGDADVSVALSTLANVRAMLGRAEEADALLERALAIRKRICPGDNEGLAVALNNLARNRVEMDRPLDAEPLYRQALEMRQRLFPGDNSAVARSLTDLGSLRASLGHPEEAEPLLSQALQMSQRLHAGIDHPDVADCLLVRASVLRSLERPVEAEPLNVQALAMYRRMYQGGC